MDLLTIKEFFKDTIRYIIFIVVVLLVVNYVFSLQQVIGVSMNPQLKDGDILILNKIKYRFFDVERGDIVAVQFKDTNYIVKRIIGLPGDTISIKNNQIYINGNLYEEDYLSKDVITEDFELTELGYDKIPENMYFVLGDNRQDSTDSRELGLVNKDNILGETFIRIFPLNSINIIK